MGHEYILEKIIADAKAEAKQILKDAKTVAKGNIEYATQQADAEKIRTTRAAQDANDREIEILQSTTEIKNRNALLRQKSQIMDEIFADVGKTLETSDNRRLVAGLGQKFANTGDTITPKDGGILISNANFEMHLGVGDLLAVLRREIESDVARILWK